jgi:hypothetical protein
MTTPKVWKRPERRWTRRVLMWLGGTLLMATAGVAAYHTVEDRRARAEMDKAISELDTSDPGWRLEDIEAARAVVPDGENSARVVVAAARELPRDWPAVHDLYEEAKKCRPNEQLPDGLARRIEEALDADGARGLRGSRGLADCPRGRHRIAYARNVITTILEDQQRTRMVGALWRLESIRQAQAGDVAAALRAARATFNAGRSIGDEPLAVTQLIRTALTLLGAEAVERALAQAPAGAAELKRWQEMALAEDRVPVYRIAARGERALFHVMLLSLVSGEVEAWELAEKSQRDWNSYLFGWRIRHSARASIPAVLQLHGRIIATADAPPELQADLEAAIDSDKQQVGEPMPFVKISVPPAAKLGEAYRRKQAGLRCLATALAVERYRLKFSRWPARLTQLVPDFLPAVPADPFDGAPIRYGTHPDGVIVYSVGRDRRDDNGAVCDNPSLDGCDLGFRLYNPDRRRLPAPAAPAEKDPE